MGEGLPAAEGCPEPAGLDAISFAMDEIRLFLDTHPTDRQALTAYAALRQRRSALVDQLAREGRPVNFYCAGASGSWDWMDGAWPWEKEE